MKKIAIFGSTGSIGVNSINVINNFPESFQVDCISAHKNTDKLYKQIIELKPERVIITNEESFRNFQNPNPGSTKILCGDEALLEYLSLKRADILINSLVGFSGLKPSIEAIRNGIKVALANKESLVTAGELLMPLLKQKQVDLVPIDSEHSAILQCLIGENAKSIKKIILTASGGPFLHKNKADFENITIEEALNHPNWKMGNKITIDSATLMNKGLEVIEAYWLFSLPLTEIEVIIHPQSIIHSMVEFIDGSIKAQLGIPDMKIPIQYALTYPERLPLNTKTLDFVKLKHLQFIEPDFNKFECLKLAYESQKTGGLAPTILNASNEIAVNMFLSGKIKFTMIPKIIEYSLKKYYSNAELTFENIFETDKLIRESLIKSDFNFS